jgi:hypothetical protein
MRAQFQGRRNEFMGASKKTAKKTAKKAGKKARKSGKSLRRMAEKAVKSLGGPKKLKQNVRKVAQATADALVNAITPKKK